jgi:4-amino-4-deoxy-L-arabinose transferase-like glycosyltransferase
LKIFKDTVKFLENEPVYIRWFIVLMVLPALFLNLGLYPFNLDEATRAVVTLEMKFSGNLIAPTINGEGYFNKPPLFNWIQLVFVNTTGLMNEFIFRLPVVLSLLGFAVSVFYSLRKELGRQLALVTALSVIISGRILFYDSFKGLIDILFSWIIYMNFYTVFNNFRKERFLRLFMFSWLLITAGFMLKGLPALVFQGITLLVWFVYRRKFLRLFSWQHIAGFALFLVIIGSYLFLFAKYHSLSFYFSNMLNESAKRTPIDNSFLMTFRHFLLFPLNFVFYFLPSSLFVLALLRKGSIAKIRQSEILVYFSVIFVSNIIVYWISPAIYPRYLFMFLPPFFAVILFSYFNEEHSSWFNRYILRYLSFVLPVLSVISIVFLLFVMKPPVHNDIELKIGLLALLSAVLCFMFYRFNQERLIILFGFIFLIRIGFDLLIFDERLHSGLDGKQRKEATEAAHLTKGKPLHLYNDCLIHNTSTYYFERERKEILSRYKGEMVKGEIYIVPVKDTENLPEHKLIAVFETNLASLKLAVIEPE